MSSSILQRISSTVLSFMALSAVFALPAQAEEYLDQGIKLFNKRQYAQSRPYFDKAAENAPWDSNAYYYQAISAQYCKDWPAAKKLWAKVIEKFPGTPAAANATAAMKSLDPGYFRRAAAAASAGDTPAATPYAGGAAASADDNVETLLANVQYTAPAQAKLPVQRADNRVLLDVQVNSRGAKFEFNGSSTVLTVKDAKALQITNADRTAVKAGTRVPVSIRMGEIIATGFPISIEDGERSRIGEDFFRKFTYRLDPTHLIVTKKLTASGGTKTGYDVPFRKSGTDMIVEVTVNGRRVSMLFDGKGGETIVPAKRVREFGLDVEESSKTDQWDPEKQSGPLRGEAGFGDVKTKATAEAKVNIGPVANQVVTIRVDEKARDAKLGTDAFGGWKFSIDPGASMIRFSR